MMTLLIMYGWHGIRVKLQILWDPAMWLKKTGRTEGYIELTDQQKTELVPIAQQIDNRLLKKLVQSERFRKSCFSLEVEVVDVYSSFLYGKESVIKEQKKIFSFKVEEDCLREYHTGLIINPDRFNPKDFFSY